MEEMENTVGSLIEQLQETNNLASRTKNEREPLKKEELENFIIQRSAALVEDSIDMVNNIRDFIVSAPTSDDVSALADLINATTSALDNLNKITLQDKKSETSIKLKEMDIKSRKELQQNENETKFLATREEVLKMLANKAKPIEAEIIEDKRID